LTLVSALCLTDALLHLEPVTFIDNLCQPKNGGQSENGCSLTNVEGVTLEN
ncbi:hypothetical protein ACJMK2_030530, partial [Sinanodonta woodiana]